jgi:hypothetical protein
MEKAIKAVFDEILSMPEDEFLAALKSHEKSKLAQALIAVWGNNEHNTSDNG